MLKLDKFGINYGDVSIGWKALHWYIPQQINAKLYAFFYPIYEKFFWKRLLKGEQS